jgi:hypothetical protein
VLLSKKLNIRTPIYSPFYTIFRVQKGKCVVKGRKTGDFYDIWRGNEKVLLVLLPQEKKCTDDCIMGKAPIVCLSSLCTGLYNHVSQNEEH